MAVSLGTRLVLIISLVLSVLMITAGVIIDRQLTRAIYEDGRHMAETHAQLMSVTLQTLMLSGQATQVRNWIQQVQKEQDVIDVYILRNDGTEAFTDTSTIAAINQYLGEQRFSRQSITATHLPIEIDELFNQALTGDVVSHRSPSGFLTVYMPLKIDKACTSCHGYQDSPQLGVLKIIQSTTDVDSRIAKMRQGLWEIAILLVVILGAVLWATVRFYVLRPVLRLHDAIVKVGAGDREARLEVRRNDELGAVSTVFNRMQVQLQASKGRSRAVTENVADGIVITDEHGIIESVNPALTRIFGYPPEALVGQSVNLLMPSPYREHHDEYIDQYIQTRDSRLMGRSRELVGLHRDGQEIPIDITLSSMVEDGRTLFIAIMRDRSERKRQMDALQHQALHDALTGLPNRTLLVDRIEQALRTAQRQDRPLALLLADLDRFKEINDTLGHFNGDRVLIQVAELLQQVVRSSDTVARLGGDEFAVLLPTAGFNDAMKICSKLLERLDQPIEIEGHTFVVGVSVGVAMFPDHGADVTTLLQRADVAMYAAKRTHSGFKLYDPDQNQHSLETISMVGELRLALEQDELFLCYQPVIDLRTHTISGVEALVRWNHPRLGVLQPDEFVPLAEQTGLIRPLTAWVLETASRQTREWAEEGLELRIAVNLSAHNLHDVHFQERFLEIIDHDRLQIPRLRLEITETTIMSGSPHALEILNQLSARGVRISIDDFGTGYSSLIYLKRLPVDEIKIDRSFVTHMTVDENDTVIVRSTIDLAHNMGLKVVAEGVEDEATYQLLGQMHCDLVQGFHISHPLPARELVEWLRQSRWQLPNR